MKPLGISSRALGLALVCVGCGGSDIDTSAFDRDEAAFLEAWIRGRCEVTARCTRRLSSSLGAPASDLRVDVCVSGNLDALDGVSHLRPGIEAGRIVYHPEHLQACLDAEAARTCSELSATPDACLMAFEGQVPVGSRCTDSYDCRGDAYCDNDQRTPADPGPCPAICKARVDEGASCVRQIECARGLRCRNPDFEVGNPSGEPVCLPPAAEGERCHGPHCADDLVCALAEAPLLTCQPLVEDLPRGAVCSSTEHCESSLACTAPAPEADRVCSVLALDDECGGPLGCGADYACGCAAPDCSEGQPPVCRPWPGEGEPCVYLPDGPFGGGALCQAGLRCLLDGVCGRGAQAGAACEENRDCRDYRCIAGRCAAPGECG